MQSGSDLFASMVRTILAFGASKFFHTACQVPPVTDLPAIRRKSMNQFDFAVALGLLAFMGLGFYAGLLRSLASILGYIAAAPVAVAATSYASPAMAGDAAPPWASNFALFFVVLLAVGALIGRLLRHSVAEVLGDHVDIVDRIAGSLLGALRLGIVVLPVVVMFDRYVPLERQPQFFAGSKLRPYFSSAGQHGINALPADVTVYLNKLTRERGI